VTAVVLLVGLPLYLRMPLWCDLTLYDLAARNLLDGGVHYRDIFDTNLPGFVWLLTAIRWVVGFGAFSLRCVDLAVVTGVVLLVDRVARRGGATAATRWWAATGAAIAYLGAVEMAHCQRDTWMALPVLAAVLLRLRRMGQAGNSFKQGYWQSALEGALWGAAVWIKPHCALMAVGVWVVTARQVAATGRRQWVGFLADLCGNVTGGLVVGVAGVVWLVASGAWPYFQDVMGFWAPHYTAMARRELGMRVEQELHWFPPWSLGLVPTFPLALLSILDATPWRGQRDATRPGPVGRVLPRWLWHGEASPEARTARGVLAALYLVWATQSFVIQRGFMYAHMAELFLMLGLWAAHRWVIPAPVILWLAITSAAWVVGDVSPPVRAWMLEIARHDSRPTDLPDKERYFVRYPLADAERLELWPDCFRVGMPERDRFRLWDKLERIQDHEAATGWEELGDVMDFLRLHSLKDGELIAWHDSPHALYLMLDIKPGVRYMHVNTAQSISVESRLLVQGELAATVGKARFAVSDLEYPALGLSPAKRAAILGPPRRPDDLLPVGLDQGARGQFPFNQRTVFRSRGGLGRYIVHELPLTGPLGDSVP